MRILIIVAILAVILVACTATNKPNDNKTLSNEEILLNSQELEQIGINQNSTYCNTEHYETSESSSLEQYSFCQYNISEIDNSEIVIQLSKLTNHNDLNGSYQYQSSHLFGSEGLISRDSYGDQSVFRVNSEDDYGAEFNNPNITYYNLYFTKDLFLVHITSKGSEDAREYIENLAQGMLGKFE